MDAKKISSNVNYTYRSKHFLSKKAIKKLRYTLIPIKNYLVFSINLFMKNKPKNY